MFLLLYSSPQACLDADKPIGALGQYNLDQPCWQLVPGDHGDGDGDGDGDGGVNDGGASLLPDSEVDAGDGLYL